MIPNEDPLGLALDYGEVEEGEIDEEAHADVQMEESSDMKGNQISSSFWFYFHFSTLRCIKKASVCAIIVQTRFPM